MSIIIDYDSTTAYAVDSDLGNLTRCPLTQNMLKSYDSELTKLKIKLLIKITIYDNEYIIRNITLPESQHLKILLLDN